MSIDLNRNHLEKVIEMADFSPYTLETTSGADYNCGKDRVEANQALFWQATDPDDDSILGNLRVVIQSEKESVYISILMDGESICHNEPDLAKWLKDTIFPVA